MKNITKPNSLKKEKFNPQTLKPGTTFDDVTRNFLIEESKIRNLESDEIQYLMTDEQYRNKKPVKTQTQKPFKKNRYCRRRERSRRMFNVSESGIQKHSNNSFKTKVFSQKRS